MSRTSDAIDELVEQVAGLSAEVSATRANLVEVLDALDELRDLVGAALDD